MKCVIYLLLVNTLKWVDPILRLPLSSSKKEKPNTTGIMLDDKKANVVPRQNR